MERVDKEGRALPLDTMRAELRRILHSPQFDASERNRRFLGYVVEEALAGRAGGIKAYAIATSVFGRDESFDPQFDSIVRVEARRLRRALEHYYLTDGKSDPIRIDIPRGGYAPAFRRVEPGPAPLRPEPSILVGVFEEEGDQSAFPSFTRGFVRSLLVALGRFAGLRVFGDDAALGRSTDMIPPADYVLTGQTSLSSKGFRIDAVAAETRVGRAIWTGAFEREAERSRLIAQRNAVAGQIARDIATDHGAIAIDWACDGERRN